MKTRTEIIVETERWIVIRRQRRTETGFQDDQDLSSTNPNGLDVHELADSKLREFAAVTGMLNTAKR